MGPALAATYDTPCPICPFCPLLSGSAYASRDFVAERSSERDRVPDAPQSGLPPWPWPQKPDDGWQNCSPGSGDTCVGSAGTPWVFKTSELRNRLLGLGAHSSLVETLAGLLDQANTRLRSWTDQTCAAELDDPNEPDPRLLWIAGDYGAAVSVDVYRAVVHAANGPAEDLAHVFHLRPKGGVTPDTSAAGCAALAARIGAAWSAWWSDTTSNNGYSAVTSGAFAPGLSYDRIIVSWVTYPGGGVKPTVNTGGVTWSFSSPLVGSGPTSNNSLPLEVAACVTLLTDTTGKRTRGRFYLGGLEGQQWMNIQGNDTSYGTFKQATARGIAGRFGTKVIDGIHNDALAQAEFNVVSRQGGSSRGIGGIKMGIVPDSQRRRRRHQQENKFLVWGTAS